MRQNQKNQHDNPAHTARLTVNFQVANIMFVLDRLPLSQDISAIKLLTATPAHTARLTVNFQVANIMFVLDRPPLSQDISVIKLLIVTLKSKGIAICQAVTFLSY